MAKYQPFPSVPVKNRRWPDQKITQAPIWCSVDLRDGNQALATPMSVNQKLEMFDLLLKIGFKEIELGFPSASQIEYDFLRRLVDDNRIPEDVTVQVLCQARKHLIDRTLESLKGVKKAIFHLYNSTSPSHRKYTFNMSKEEVIDIAVGGVSYLKSRLDTAPGTELILEYSPESFSNTEIDFSLEICEAVMAAWEVGPGEKIILNLPATVESSTPNLHADQIEYFCGQISNRENIIISLHPHNDRGTAVAAAELGLLAGADRVEGTLFGNGERTGNLDVVTMALNMFTQGVDPCLDFTNIPRIVESYTRLTGMDVPLRQPYAGELVFTAFSGSHQDAIRKALSARAGKPEDTPWDVTYLPLDPKDISREYEAIIRINSQSGKGGVAYILETEYGINMPKAMHPEFGSIVNDKADRLGRELSKAEIKSLFDHTYFSFGGTPRLSVKSLNEVQLEDDGSETVCRADLLWDGKELLLNAEGNGPMDAFVRGLKKNGFPDFCLNDFHEHAVGQGSGTEAMAYTEIIMPDNKRFWGCGRDTHVGLAGIRSIISALNRGFLNSF